MSTTNNGTRYAVRPDEAGPVSYFSIFGPDEAGPVSYFSIIDAEECRPKDRIVGSSYRKEDAERIAKALNVLEHVERLDPPPVLHSLDEIEKLAKYLLLNYQDQIIEGSAVDVAIVTLDKLTKIKEYISDRFFGSDKDVTLDHIIESLTSASINER